jgi:hypothetical protein
MALGSTQSLTEMNTRNLSGGKGRQERKADNITAICEPTVWKMWEPRCLITLSYFWSPPQHFTAEANKKDERLGIW